MGLAVGSLARLQYGGENSYKGIVEEAGREEVVDEEGDDKRRVWLLVG